MVAQIPGHNEASPYGDVVYEYDGSSGTALASYVLGGTGLVSQTQSGTTSYFLQNGQGSTSGLTNGSGGLSDTYSYTAFGELFDQSGTTDNNYLYTGQQFDSLTGLYSLRARYYNPALGRFLSQDTHPYNFGNPVELNRYVYTGNNPINAMDPSGHLAAENVFLGSFSLGRTVTIAAILVTAAIVIGAVVRLVGTEERTWTWERILALEESESQLAPNRNPNTNPTVFPPPFPVTPNVPTTPQPTETRQPSKKVLIVGDGTDFSYTLSLALLRGRWDITGSIYGDKSNNQYIINKVENVTLVNNVDATRLESGAVTGSNLYDAIILNNPFVRIKDDYSSARLIQNFIQSARTRLTSNGVIHINVTKEFLFDYPMSAEALGLFNNSRRNVERLPTFGDTEYFAPYMPQYNTGNDYPFDSPLDVQKLKNLQFR